MLTWAAFDAELDTLTTAWVRGRGEGSQWHLNSHGAGTLRLGPLPQDKGVWCEEGEQGMSVLRSLRHHLSDL